MMAAVSRMWNLPCTFVSSMLWQPLQLHHEDDNPPIIIMGNGGDAQAIKFDVSLEKLWYYLVL